MTSQYQNCSNKAIYVIMKNNEICYNYSNNEWHLLLCVNTLYTSYSLPYVVLKNTDRYYYLPHFMNKKLSFWQILTTTDATKLSLAISLFPSESSKPFSHLIPFTYARTLANFQIPTVILRASPSVREWRGHPHHLC